MFHREYVLPQHREELSIKRNQKESTASLIIEISPQHTPKVEKEGLLIKTKATGHRHDPRQVLPPCPQIPQAWQWWTEIPQAWHSGHHTQPSTMPWAITDGRGTKGSACNRTTSTCSPGSKQILPLLTKLLEDCKGAAHQIYPHCTFSYQLCMSITHQKSQESPPTAIKRMHQ